jgi:hypothetical protein
LAPLPLIAVLLTLLSGCQSSGGETDDTTLLNRASALERSADATTDATIKQIEDESDQDSTGTSSAAGSAAGKAKK